MNNKSLQQRWESRGKGEWTEGDMGRYSGDIRQKSILCPDENEKREQLKRRREGDNFRAEYLRVGGRRWVGLMAV